MWVQPQLLPPSSESYLREFWECGCFEIVAKSQAGREDPQQSGGPGRRGSAGWPGNQKLKASSCKLPWGSQRQDILPVSQDSSLESGARAEQVALFPLWSLPHTQHHKVAKRVALPWQIPYHVTGARRQRNMSQMKEQIKTPEKELSSKELDSLFDAEFKTVIIRILIELIELSHKMKGRNEGYTKWNKAKYTGNQQWREGNLGLKSMIWNNRKK